MNIQKYEEGGFKTSSWQGGTTTELFIFPPDAEYSKRNFLCRMSSAAIDTERSDFTVLNGIQRFLVPLTDSLKISHDGKYFTKLKPYEVYAFDGGSKTVSEGRVRDFNLMLKDGIDGFVKSFFLSPFSVLKFGIAPGEMGWIFSYNNLCTINIEGPGIKESITASKMTFVTFTSAEKEYVLVSMEKQGSLIYGKIVADAMSGEDHRAASVKQE